MSSRTQLAGPIDPNARDGARAEMLLDQLISSALHNQR
jgi:hypothetical protein